MGYWQEGYNAGRPLVVNNYNNNGNLNGNNNFNNNGRFVGIALNQGTKLKTYRHLYEKLCSYENLELAFKKARKHKTLKPYVIEFEKHLKENLLLLRTELLIHSYSPKPLKTFILMDPKTRKISKSDFRDRVVHHAVCNIIEPIFEKSFIYDSHANRKGKGTLKAIQRFECFKRKITSNGARSAFVLKADIRHYFDTVSHNALIRILKKKINDKKLLLLIKRILKNHQTKINERGMPLGNLTSQFFANVYLNELDQFVKYNLKAKYYIRYVDDFVVLSRSKKHLEYCQYSINNFLEEKLGLHLHPDKSRVLPLKKGIDFLGLRIFQHHKLLRKSNIRKFKRKFKQLCIQFDSEEINYDIVYDFLEGWAAYSKQANAYNLRGRILGGIENKFEKEISTKEINRLIRLADNKNL